MTNLAQKEILIEVELDELLENPWTYFDCNLLVNGKEVRISVDEFAENPLEWDCNPTLLSLLRRYNIGVKTIIDKNGEKEFSVPDDFESIDDIEAELNGKTKQEVIQMFYDCFAKNDYGNHFLKYWKNVSIDETGKLVMEN